ncbi:hypothetical protein PT2222_220094 [Paraburkholderia tropica]
MWVLEPITGRQCANARGPSSGAKASAVERRLTWSGPGTPRASDGRGGAMRVPVLAWRAQSPGYGDEIDNGGDAETDCGTAIDTANAAADGTGVRQRRVRQGSELHSWQPPELFFSCDRAPHLVRGRV